MEAGGYEVYGQAIERDARRIVEHSSRAIGRQIFAENGSGYGVPSPKGIQPPMGGMRAGAHSCEAQVRTANIKGLTHPRNHHVSREIHISLARGPDNRCSL